MQSEAPRVAWKIRINYYTLAIRLSLDVWFTTPLSTRSQLVVLISVRQMLMMMMIILTITITINICDETNYSLASQLT